MCRVTIIYVGNAVYTYILLYTSADVSTTVNAHQVDQDTYWNEQHTSNSAKMAVGSVIELADKVVTGEVKVHCQPIDQCLMMMKH